VTTTGPGLTVRRQGHRRFGPAALALAAAGLSGAAACRDPARNFDSRPIPLGRGPGGELLVQLADDDGVTPTWGLLDTGSPLTFWRNPNPAAAARIVERNLIVLGTPGVGQSAPVRAVLGGVLTVEAPLGPVGTPADSLLPRAVLGGDLLSGLSIEISMYTPTLTLWRRQPANDGFLSAVGYAVLHLPRRGGGQLVALDPPDRLGQRGSHQYPASRLLLRACAAPDPFDRTRLPAVRCCAAEERKFSTGTDLSLLLATGMGPLVLGRSAWERVQAGLPPGTAVSFEERPLLVAQSEQPVPARWTHLPRLALVNGEAEHNIDPGPCAELGRSRRLELVAMSQAKNAERAACALLCDRDPGDRNKAQNSAAYVELGGSLEVAVIEDVTPFLQTIRNEVRPGGPEVDGLLGAAALAELRFEIDPFTGNDSRAIITCEASNAPERCRAVGRCPRLPDRGQRRSCFGLPPHGLPQICEDAEQCPE
jgi:hypothetical protein